METEKLSRTEMLLIKKAAKQGWSVDPAKQAENIARLKAVIADPERYNRDREKAQEALDAIEAASGVQS